MQFNYDIYEQLCFDRGKAPSTAAHEAGIAKNQPGKWKRGEVIPSSKTLMKLSAYFSVPVDFFAAEIDTPEVIKAYERSTVAINNSGAVATNGASISQGQTEQLSDMETELLRIFRSLDMRKKNALMSCAYDIEDTMRKEE